MPQNAHFENQYVTAADGLRLHVKIWNGDNLSGTTVVCLPGLARTADDFDVLAQTLVNKGKVKVLALDLRGRGLSDRDKNWRNYDMRVENNDILTVLTAMEVEHADFVGTSRGGLHLFMFSATRPGMMRRIVLNDIGPVLEAKGLARIRGYVGKLPAPKSWDDAVDLCRRIMSAQFTGLSDEDWRAYAQLTFCEDNGKFVARYDPKLTNTLASLDLTRPLPELWPQFSGLNHVPVLAIRGANSDLLSEKTLEQMASRHRQCQTHVVEGQGHAPLLRDEPSITRICDFLSAD